MFFRSPFFRFVTHDLEHMMNRSLLRQEMMMRNELQRAMNAFEALEQPAVQRAKAPEALKGKEAEAKPRLTKETEAPTLKAEKAEVDAMKTKESETQAVKAKEGEGKVSPKEQEMSVQPSKGDPFALWDNSIDHFFRDVSPFGYRSSVFDSFYPRFNSIGRLAEEMRADMDRHFKTLENPEAKEEYPTLADPENTSYFMRVESNDNGHVKVKTVKKVPGSDWVSKFEEYKAGKALEKDASESKQAIENKEASQNKERPVEIAEEPLKRDSESASPSASA